MTSNTDLIARLREAGTPVKLTIGQSTPINGDLCIEAASTILSLSSQVEELTRDFAALQKAVVGESGLSAITVAGELRARADAADANYAALLRRSTDKTYFLEAYHNMLGPIALKVAAMWQAKKVSRIHYSWGPEAAKLTGEERAQFILDLEEAAKTAVPIESIDRNALSGTGK